MGLVRFSRQREGGRVRERTREREGGRGGGGEGERRVLDGVGFGGSFKVFEASFVEDHRTLFLFCFVYFVSC